MLSPKVLFRILNQCLVAGMMGLSVCVVQAAPETERTAEVEPVGLVLSGGGARGFAHIGVLKALEELRVPVDLVTATSMGALVGGAYAAGLSPEHIERITLGVHWPSMLAPRPEREQLAWRLKEDDRLGLGLAEVGLTKRGLLFPSEVIPAHELEMFLERSTAPVRQETNLNRLSIPFACIATDLRTGESVVLQEGVTLPQAMRASMSIPGVFAPVRLNGRLLVDGGLVDNLPIVEARKLGAKKLIAVNVGTPLGQVGEFSSIVDFTGQMISILTEQNVKTSLMHVGGDDVLITPDLSEFNSADFEKAEQIIRVGYEATMAHKERLQRYSVSPQVYEQWRGQHRLATSTQEQYRIDSVRVEGVTHANKDAVLGSLDMDISKPVSVSDIEESARLIWADGHYSSVPYRFEPGPNNTEVLVFEPKEKEWGASTLRIGGNVQTNFRDNHTYNLLLAHTMSWVNAWGAEWRNELQFGHERGFLTQWTQPLGAGSPWFARPFVDYRWLPFDVYDQGDHPIAQYRTEKFQTGIKIGRSIARKAVANVDVGWIELKTVEEIGTLNMGRKLNSPYVGGQLWYDTLDNASFPTKGLYVEADAWYYWGHDRERSSFSNSNGTYRVSAMLPIALNRRWTLTLNGEIGRSDTPGYFNLGGVFKLSGSPFGRFSGSNMEFGRISLTRRLKGDWSGLDMPMYGGISFEAGRAYDSNDFGLKMSDRDWKQSGSLFVGADTWIGPMYLVVGHTRGHSTSLVFYWGRLPL
ncbi:MAG: patatin-like phospholipase family protein [Duodenibacillus sp.]|nr:patatin-like phospholipase family protein [Duodenibacillus sp.]